jgi:hypothetical protein
MLPFWSIRLLYHLCPFRPPRPAVEPVVYRDGDVSVIVAASDDGTAVTGQYTTTRGP